jgi:hypothetical protein
MQLPSAVLNVGADGAKGEIVVACLEESFPVRKIDSPSARCGDSLSQGPARGQSHRYGIHCYVSRVVSRGCHWLDSMIFVLNPKDARGDHVRRHRTNPAPARGAANLGAHL